MAQTSGTCLISEICCGGSDCCDPAFECCDNGICVNHPVCDPCETELDINSCSCVPLNTSCPPGQFACGNICCDNGDTCGGCPGGVPNCIGAP